MADKSDKFFGSFQKGEKTEVRITRNTFKQYTYLDIREFYLADEDTNEWRPSKKGITVPWKKDALAKFLEIIKGPVQGEFDKVFYPIEAEAKSDGETSNKAGEATADETGDGQPF